MFAGAGSAIRKLGKWSMNGTLKMQSAAAVNGAEEIPEHHPWLPSGGNRISPLIIPENRPPEQVPGNAKEILRAAGGGSRAAAAAARHTGVEWWEILPRDEVHELVWEKMERGEIATLFQLRHLGLTAAEDILQLQPTRGGLKEAFNRIWRNRAARVT